MMITGMMKTNCLFTGERPLRQGESLNGIVGNRRLRALLGYYSIVVAADRQGNELPAGALQEDVAGIAFEGDVQDRGPDHRVLAVAAESQRLGPHEEDGTLALLQTAGIAAAQKAERGFDDGFLAFDGGDFAGEGIILADEGRDERRRR